MSIRMQRKLLIPVEDLPAHDKLAAETQSKSALRVFTINDVNANVVGARHTNGGGAYLSDGDIKILKIEGMSSAGPAGSRAP